MPYLPLSYENIDLSDTLEDRENVLVPSLFSLLNINSEEKDDWPFYVPHTLIFKRQENGDVKIENWFFSSKFTCAILRKNKRSLRDHKKVRTVFCGRGKSEQVATDIEARWMYHYDANAGEDVEEQSGEDGDNTEKKQTKNLPPPSDEDSSELHSKLHVEYLSHGDIDVLLTALGITDDNSSNQERKKSRIIHREVAKKFGLDRLEVGILQKFVACGENNSVIHVEYDGGESCVVERCTNVNAVWDVTKTTYARCSTYTYSGPENVSAVITDVVGEVFPARLEQACRSIANHLFAVSQGKLRLESTSLYFKVDNYNHLWLVWCDSLMLEELEYDGSEPGGAMSTPGSSRPITGRSTARSHPTTRGSDEHVDVFEDLPAPTSLFSSAGLPGKTKEKEKITTGSFRVTHHRESMVKPQQPASLVHSRASSIVLTNHSSPMTSTAASRADSGTVTPTGLDYSDTVLAVKNARKSLSRRKSSMHHRRSSFFSSRGSRSFGSMSMTGGSLLGDYEPLEVSTYTGWKSKDRSEEEAQARMLAELKKKEEMDKTVFAPGTGLFTCPRCRLAIYISQVCATPIRDIVRDYERTCQLYSLFPEIAKVDPHSELFLDDDEGNLNMQNIRIPPTLSFSDPSMTRMAYMQNLTDPTFLLSTIELCADCFRAVVPVKKSAMDLHAEEKETKQRRAHTLQGFKSLDVFKNATDQVLERALGAEALVYFKAPVPGGHTRPRIVQGGYEVRKPWTDRWARDDIEPIVTENRTKYENEDAFRVVSRAPDEGIRTSQKRFANPKVHTKSMPNLPVNEIAANLLRKRDKSTALPNPHPWRLSQHASKPRRTAKEIRASAEATRQAPLHKQGFTFALSGSRPSSSQGFAVHAKKTMQRDVSNLNTTLDSFRMGGSDSARADSARAGKINLKDLI